MSGGFGVDRSGSTSSGAAGASIPETLIDAKGDLIAGSAADTAARLAVGTDKQRLAALASTATGLVWVDDTQNTVADAKGDLLVGTAADTIAKLAVGANNTRLVADSAQTTGLKYVADTTNYAIAAKGDLLVGTAASTVAPLTVGADDTVPIADSAQSGGIRWGTVPAATVRQTQLVGPVDSSGYNATLSAGAGLNFNVDATPTNVVYTFANGFGTGGAVDTYTVLSADASNQGSLNASNTHYIHATRSSATAVTWSQALVPPQYGYAFDQTQGSLLTFEAADASTAIIDDFGNTWTASGNAQIDTAQFKFGTSSLLLDGTGDYVTSTSITTLGPDSWEISQWFRINALPGAASRATLVHLGGGANLALQLVLFNNAGTTKLEFSASSNNSSNDIANATVGANTTWTLNQWNKVRIVFDALAGTYKIYLSLAGAAETADISVSSTSRVHGASTKLVVGMHNDGVTSPFNGWIDAFRFIRCATVTTTETPGLTAPAITDYPYHWFSIPEMKMYQVTSASASAGTNPGMTRKDRIFVGECDTNGASVTAVRNYALRGEYIGASAAWPSTSTQVSFSHNLGVVPRNVRVLAVNVTTDQGHAPGDELELPWTSNATYAAPTQSRKTRTGGSFATEATTSLVVIPKAGGNAAGATAANWRYRVEAQRGW